MLLQRLLKGSSVLKGHIVCVRVYIYMFIFMIYTFLCIYLSKSVCHAEIFWGLYERRFRIVA